ncbi:PIR Superfamily Protein [Plasmodium ovale wallikeri]|uniref:PIR Superfamily Protein n=1 Tax=Plasmodium ovale wallikeri TaxID=864142 RepID=A0A1A9AN54_PLAOA|nr:PIR Superfamily Protein [Plasmodium ovale wallikeri]SBT57652.1 PIR Superfamily Protein [Plasmodium ovale wallikeri]
MEGEKILTNLSKYKLYNKFIEKCEDKNKYITYCKTMQYLEYWYNDILELCCVFAKNFIDLHAIFNEKKNINEPCRYFNFWVTDILRKNWENVLKDKHHINYILLGLYAVENTIRTSTQNNNCRFDYRSKVDLNLWKEWKHLHDYIENYNDIKQRIKSDVHSCKIYPEYFAHIKTLHDKYKSECCNGSSDKCPHHIDLSYICNSDTLSNELECDKTKGITTASPGDKEPQPMVGSPEDERSPLLSALSPEHNVDANADGITNNTDYYSKLGVSFSFLGILPAFLYMYKFTTFGNWIRSKVLKNKMKVNLDEDTQNLTTHELNNFDENNFTDGYNITYHPS